MYHVGHKVCNNIFVLKPHAQMFLGNIALDGGKTHKHAIQKHGVFLNFGIIWGLS
jgi:hypothetical protein